MLLAAVVTVSFRMVQTNAADIPGDAASSAGVSKALQTPVAPQAVVIEAKSSLATLPPATADEKTVVDRKADAESERSKREQVWEEINEAISGLNDLVGAEMFLDVRRKQKGQLEIRLDDSLWNRVRYQTRVDLKTDISNLWHLYVKEYGYSGSSVVYFMDDSSGRVIDIFSKANQ